MDVYIYSQRWGTLAEEEGGALSFCAVVDSDHSNSVDITSSEIRGPHMCAVSSWLIGQRVGKHSKQAEDSARNEAMCQLCCDGF